MRTLLSATVYRSWQVCESGTRGDRLVEEVASKTDFLNCKDYPSMFLSLSDAAAAYKSAQDKEGAEVSILFSVFGCHSLLITATVRFESKRTCAITCASPLVQDFAYGALCLPELTCASSLSALDLT